MLCAVQRSGLKRLRTFETARLCCLGGIRSATGKASDEDTNQTQQPRTEPPAPTMGENPDAFIRQKDEAQRKFMEKNSGKVKEMPPDLQAFISSHAEIVEDTTSTLPVTPRLPRYMRDEEEKHKGGRPDFSDGRIQEKIPLVEKIQGFDTIKTTNFSRREDKTPVRVYQGGDVIDIYDLLLRRENGEEDEDALVEKVYAEYGKKHKLPDEDHQIRHKKMLKNTLRYLRIPVLMRDPKGGPFDGVPKEKVKDVEMFQRIEVVPKTTAKYVLEDLLDNRAIEVKQDKR